MVIKIGGSLINRVKDIVCILEKEEAIIVPGGGIFADFIRGIDYNMNLIPKASHSMAILAMQQYGVYMSSVTNIPTSNNIHSKVPFIFEPYQFLKNVEEIKPTWEATSDAIAVYIAHYTGCKEVILLKSVKEINYNEQKINKISASELISLEQDVVDTYLIKFLIQYKINCYIYDASDIKKFKTNFTKRRYDIVITYNKGVEEKYA